MATFDGSIPLDVGREEFHECGPCLWGGKRKGATHYCESCPDYLCDDCKDYHGNLTVTRNHTIVPVIGTPVSGTGASGHDVTCSCNNGLPVTFYCSEHHDIICGDCEFFSHQACKTTNFQEKCSTYKTWKLNSVLTEITTLKGKYERLKQKSSDFKNEINQLKDACLTEIKRFRKELDRILDNLENNILQELDKWEEDEHHDFDEDMSAIETDLKLLQIDQRRLEDVKKCDKKETMFITDIQMTKDFKSCRSKLEKLEKTVMKPTLAFERNELLAAFAIGVKSLGSLKVQSKECRHVLTNTTESTNMRGDRKIKSRDEVNITESNDQDIPYITGCTVMPNGHVVLCDRNNKQIKVLDDTWAITGRLKLPGLWDVSVVDSSNVIVSLPDNMKLQKVRVFPKLKVVSNIKLDKKCWGVAVDASKDEIYVTLNKDLNEGEVRVLDMQGMVRKRYVTRPDGPFSLTSPYYITVSPFGEKMFVSDYLRDTILCLKPKGGIIYTYKDDDMRRPRGLICSSGGNVLVCGEYSKNIHIISPDGKKYDTLVTPKHDLREPCSIAYKEKDATLIVGGYNMDEILLFKLARGTWQ